MGVAQPHTLQGPQLCVCQLLSRSHSDGVPLPAVNPLEYLGPSKFFKALFSVKHIFNLTYNPAGKV